MRRSAGSAGWAGPRLAGAALVIIARLEVDVSSLPGTLCAIGALTGITAGTLYEKRFGLNHHPVVANGVQYLVGLAFVGPAALMIEDLHIHWTPNSPRASPISSSAIR